jgi:1-acyl-sn-glycerol-3-phosphate acyltransferase
MRATSSRPVISPAVRLLRATRVALHLAQGIATAAIVLPWLAPAARAARVQRWSARLLHILAVRLKVSGAPASDATPVMIVANHVSWLDVYALNAVRPVRFVAKSEVGRWPLIGMFARRAGTLFVERARPTDVFRVNALVEVLLRNGETIALFPEGTTSSGHGVLPFRAPLLQPAIQCNAHLQAVAIRYTRADGSLCSEADYTGDKSLLTALRLLLTQPVIHLQLQFLPALLCDGRHRRDVAHEAEERIAAALGLANSGMRLGTSAAPEFPPGQPEFT